MRVRALAAACALASVLAGVALAGKLAPGAKKHFDQGQVAYQREDYTAAAAEFRAAYTIDADARVLYAWAQAERLGGHCEVAAPLYEKLLAQTLPDEVAANARNHLATCRALIEGAHQAEPVDAGPPPPPPDAAPAPADAAPAADTDVEPAAADAGVLEIPSSPPTRIVHDAWYRDRVGGALVASGLVAMGIGIYFESAASGALDDARDGASDKVVTERLDAAQLDRIVGGVGLAVGGGLVVGGVLRYLLHDSSHTVDVTVSPASGGDGAVAVTFGGTF